MRVAVLTLALLFLAACSSQADSSDASELTHEAQKMLRESSRNEVNQKAIELLQRALAQDPDFLPARQERLNLFLLEKDYRAAILEAEEIVRIRDIPETRLYLCMLREIQSPGHQGRNLCYSDIAARIEARENEPEANLNYVLALRLSESSRFPSVAAKYISGVEMEEVKSTLENLLYEKTRVELVNSYLPVE